MYFNLSYICLSLAFLVMEVLITRMVVLGDALASRRNGEERIRD